MSRDQAQMAAAACVVGMLGLAIGWVVLGNQHARFGFAGCLFAAITLLLVYRESPE